MQGIATQHRTNEKNMLIALTLLITLFLALTVKIATNILSIKFNINIEGKWLLMFVVPTIALLGLFLASRVVTLFGLD